ncbi:hypothetical protein DPEC_G00333300 [Dallia pectoralis]|uniref:Uncharacterized protein n=1 Tax=Dallia pectoralis TaxID=75939 RepID=A0ACC2F6D4_DALPE|nr:hypothetical protein DPEC_G00333300 [Dallia pectoralis]
MKAEEAGGVRQKFPETAVYINIDERGGEGRKGFGACTPWRNDAVKPFRARPSTRPAALRPQATSRPCSQPPSIEPMDSGSNLKPAPTTMCYPLFAQPPTPNSIPGQDHRCRALPYVEPLVQTRDLTSGDHQGISTLELAVRQENGRSHGRA